jgi:hypothetical protein
MRRERPTSNLPELTTFIKKQGPEPLTISGLLFRNRWPRPVNEHFRRVSVPANTPSGIIDKLNRDINAGLADFKARLIELGALSLTFSPAEFGKLIVEEPKSGAR